MKNTPLQPGAPVLLIKQVVPGPITWIENNRAYVHRGGTVESYNLDWYRISSYYDKEVNHID
ncbi:hypothetical protein LJK88_20295 [Paenibacillus sp. P26]|nr:hypothetical protein LJK88_20295 [Paenibacillus sp. P26]UUZ96022.1 hypothetical protein LJK87_17585 [Paenibacillus sp. P25]